MGDLKAFQEQVKTGKLDSVRAALAEDPSLLDQTNEAGQSSFLLARYYRQPAVADYLLSLNPKLDIFTACVAGLTPEVLKALDANPELLAAHNPDGWTPLHLAVFFGHPALAEALLARGAEVDSRSTNAMQNTPLHAAAAGGSAAAVRVLLEHGANVNARQHGGWTALHSAAQSGNREIAELLFAQGADLNLRADNNQGPLDMALSHGHSDIAALIEQLGARLQ